MQKSPEFCSQFEEFAKSLLSRGCQLQYNDHQFKRLSSICGETSLKSKAPSKNKKVSKMKYFLSNKKNNVNAIRRLSIIIYKGYIRLENKTPQKN